jgi:hypothetical protein
MQLRGALKNKFLMGYYRPYLTYAFSIFLAVFLADCARMKQNMAAYDAKIKASQPKQEPKAKPPENEKFKLIVVKKPPEDLKVVYKTKEELTRILEDQPRYITMNDMDKSIELKMVPVGGLVKVLEKEFIPGNEYTVELYSHTYRIGKCSNDLPATFADDFDSDVELSVSYSAPFKPGEAPSGKVSRNIKVECPVEIPNPDTLYIHVSKNSSKYAVYQLILPR